MPYITQKQRNELTQLDRGVATEGELNFIISDTCDAYLCQHGGLSYTNINTVIGALECAKLELYRRLAANYEDEKCVENGDVYQVLK